jgi:hypothetical protein
VTTHLHRHLYAMFASWADLPAQGEAALAHEGWTASCASDSGRVSAIAITRGTEIHFAIAPDLRHRVIRRHRVAQFLRPLFLKHGFLTTRVHGADRGNTSFIERLGFRKTWSEGEVDHYMLSELPFARAKKEN